MFERIEDINRNYILCEKIGIGGFSQVKRCVHKTTGTNYAAKIIAKRNLTLKDVKNVESEVKICSSLLHPNIVRLWDHFADDANFYLIFELASGGELFEDIVSRKCYTEADASKSIRQVCEGLSYCHSRHILHGDLKPENLLICREGDQTNIKIADFGLAMHVDQSKYHGFFGTPTYVAPEMILKKPYSFPIDMWACGVILYILLAGYQPFFHAEDGILYQSIIDGNYTFHSPDWDSTSDSAKEIVTELLTLDPGVRLTAEQVLGHPWIENPGSCLHRQRTLENLRNFNARRKMKATALTALLAANKFGMGMFIKEFVHH